jgi:hypothetical protein
MATPHVTAAAALCLAEGATPGPCAGESPSQVIGTLRSIAEAGASSANGFTGDPFNPIGSRYYGYLLRAAIPPTATTDSASAGDHDATLAGTLNPGGASSTWWFEYGTTTDYGQSTPAESAAADPNPTPVQAPVSDLDSGTTYHYRVVMQTGEWTIRGPDNTLTTTGTPPPPPPDTQITTAPPTRTSGGSFAILFAASPAAGATFECRLDGSSWSACTSPHQVSVGEGTHTFDVRASNGKPDPTPASTTWIVDTTPPNTLIPIGPVSPTTSTYATFSFASSESLVTYECSLDGGSWTRCTSPYPLTGLTPGQHRLEVRATDAVGLVDASPALYDWVVSPALDSTPVPPSLPGPPAETGPIISTAPGAALLPVARVAPRGAIRLDRRRGRVSLTLDCHGPGPCAGRLSVLIRGMSVAGATFRIAAGGRQSFRLRLGRQSRRVLRRPAPRTAGLALTSSARTALGKSVTRLLT